MMMEESNFKIIFLLLIVTVVLVMFFSEVAKEAGDRQSNICIYCKEEQYENARR